MDTICYHSSLVNSNLTISQELLGTEDLRENFESIESFSASMICLSYTMKTQGHCLEDLSF